MIHFNSSTMTGFQSKPSVPAIKNKTFVICIPGKLFSKDFMLNLFDLVNFIRSNGGKFFFSVQYYPIVNMSRCACLGADVTRGRKQKPFNEEIKYDYLLWIDSDIIFNNDLFLRLVNANKDLVSGWYCQPSNNADGSLQTPVTENASDEYFNEYGGYKFLSSKEIEDKKNLFKVDYIGFGWVLVKKGVFESLEYPWFAPRMRYMLNDVQDLCSEDVAFCIDAKNAGFEIWVDPKCRVGHEKMLVI